MSSCLSSLICAGILGMAGLSRAAEATLPTSTSLEPGDIWLTNAPAHPALAAGASIDSEAFTNLHAETLGGRLTVSWAPGISDDAGEATRFTLHASAAAPNHWPVRDWRSFPLNRSGQLRQADVAAEDLDVPIVYYAQAASPQGTRVSPLRILIPRRLGLEQPTRLFWPFLEGFEQGFEGWWPLSPPGLPALQTTRESKNGRAALLVTLPAHQGSVRVATTRVRGWQLVQEGASGLAMWLRTRSGQGSVRCSLQAHSSTTKLATGTWARQISVGPTWTKVELPFADLPILPWRSVDLFVLEFRSDKAAELLVDELQFLGPWKLDP